MKTIKLKYKKSVLLIPKSPYNFNSNFHKPSHFPSSDNYWEDNSYWITMTWKGKKYGLKFINKGTSNKPKIKLIIYSNKELSKKLENELIEEINYRFNFYSDITEFTKKYKKDRILGKIIKKRIGMKPVSANSLYEILVIYFVLQNATVRRSVQMLENLFEKFGTKLIFDHKELFSFWEPKDMKKTKEEDLRQLKLGYRAKSFIKLRDYFLDNKINEIELRKKSKEEVKKEVLKIYGVGPASIEYLLFEDFYFLDALEIIPFWEQKILSRLLFNKKLVDSKRILDFFKKRYPKYEKLAFHYVWEDLFWKRKNEKIEWLEKEIRL